MRIKESDFRFFNLTGENECILENIISKFNNDCCISQWHEKFTLMQTGGIKTVIPKIQAIQLIDLLKLYPIKSELFKNGITWRLENTEK